MAGFLSAGVPDPTDFPNEADAPGLRKLDTALRCPICGELFDAPVTLTCGHCFCSMCIRPALGVKQECPTCRKSANEGQLRPNPVLEDSVNAWEESRPFMLKLIKENERPKDVELGKFTTPKKRRRIEHTPSPERSASVAPGTSRATPSNGKARRGSKLSSGRPGVLPDSEKIREPTSDSDEVEIVAHSSEKQSNQPKPNELVTCPLCNTQQKYRLLDSHIENGCKPKETTSSQWFKILPGPSKGSSAKGKMKSTDQDDEHPLPKMSYTTLSTKQLKDLLSDHGLPTSGERTVLEQRHQHWVILYNSNLDRKTKPKTKAELRKELRKWEDEVSQRRKLPVHVADSKEYERQHNAQFKALTAAARATLSKSDTTRIPSSSPSIPMQHADAHAEPPPSSPML